MSEEWNQDPRNSNWTDANTARRLTETEVNSSIQLIKNRYVIEASLNHILTNGWSFVGSGQAKRPWSPCNVEGEKKEKGEVLHLFRCYTHTHTRPDACCWEMLSFHVVSIFALHVWKLRWTVPGWLHFPCFTRRRIWYGNVGRTIVNTSTKIVVKRGQQSDKN